MIESTIVVKTSRIGKREKTYENGNEILRLLHFLTFEKKTLPVNLYWYQ